MDLTIRIRNYKSIRDVTLPLKTGLNILIGPNGSGKSCICSALTFLHDILLRGAAQAVAHAGGPHTVYHRGTRQIQFHVRHNFGERLCRRKRVPFHFDWQISVSQSGKDGIAAITSEVFTITADHPAGDLKMLELSAQRQRGKKPRFRTHVCDSEDCGMDFLSMWKNFYRRQSKAKIHQKFTEHLRDLVSYFKEVEDRSLFYQAALMDDKIQEVVRYIQGLSEYNILPDVARAATEQLPFALMRPDGEGVSQVIHALEQGDYYRIQNAAYPEIDDVPYFYYSRARRSGGRWRRRPFFSPFYFRGPYGHPKERTLGKALASIQTELAAGVKPIEQVATGIDQTTGRRYLEFKSDRHTFRPEEVSDGTVKWLCILVSIYVPHSPLYVLEEPENFLHPWMQQRLVSTMREQATESKTIFLLTSHSTTILNATQPEEILVVTPSRRGTVVHGIPNRKEIEQVLSQSEFRLGDLWVSGAIEGVPTHEG